MDYKYMFHYTAMDRWEKIKETGFLKLTPSNLLQPVHPHMEVRDGVPTVVDETDSYKPVVWLTCLEDFGPEQLGLSKAKQQIQIAVPYNKEKHLLWVDWKDKNRMKKSWFKKLTGHGERFGSWYIFEEPIPMSEFAWVKDMTTGEILYYHGD